MKLHQIQRGIFFILILSASICAAPGDVDLSFNPPSLTEGVNPSFQYAVAVQTDGKILVGGSFDAVGGTARHVIARFNPNGSLDASFNTPLQKGGLGVEGEVLDIEILPDGKILVAGFFYVSAQLKLLVRLNADGSLDASFNANLGGTNIYEIVLQPDGKIIIGSNGLETVDGVPVNYLARLNTNGTLDTPLGAIANSNNVVFGIALQPDGKIVVGGSFYLTRLNANGTLDAAFNPPDIGLDTIYSLALQADGKILIGGTFTTVNGEGRNLLARLNANGTLDAAFAPTIQFSGYVWKIMLQADGKILFGGLFIRVNGSIRGRIARVNQDGSLDAFHPAPNGASSDVFDIAVQADGKVLIVGNFEWVGDVNNVSRPGVARLLDDNQTPVQPTKLKVAGGNILVGSPGQGIILKSPGGAACKLLSIDNAGAMVLTTVPCP